jgi:hypothetical protein
MSGAGILDAATGEYRSSHTGIEDRIACGFQPRSQQRDMRRTSDAVSAFNDNQFADGSTSMPGSAEP